LKFFTVYWIFLFNLIKYIVKIFKFTLYFFHYNISFLILPKIKSSYSSLMISSVGKSGSNTGLQLVHLKKQWFAFGVNSPSPPQLKNYSLLYLLYFSHTIIYIFYELYFIELPNSWYWWEGDIFIHKNRTILHFSLPLIHKKIYILKLFWVFIFIILLSIY